MAKDLIFEIGSEELPAGFIANALTAVENLLKEKLSTKHLSYKSIRKYSTPRRLAVIIEGLDEKEPTVTTEVKGPSKAASYDKDFRPTNALMGFARSQGVKPETLKIISTDKGEYVYAVRKINGKPTEKLLPVMLKEAIQSLTFPKTMRWGNHDITYARPIHRILAVYGGNIIKFDYGHIKSGNSSFGHRFIKDRGGIKITTEKSYIDGLIQRLVIIDCEERKRIISDGLKKEAAKVKGSIFRDDPLLEEVVNLVEYPVVIRGSFDKEFLKLPKEVVINAMREHQRYFSVVDKVGEILPCFITVANTPVKDKGVVRKGNERVLKARLNDAKFYFEKDIKTPLKDRVNALKGVVYHSKLGTSHEKVMRFTRLAIDIGYKIGYCLSLGFPAAQGPEDFLKDDYNPKNFSDKTKISPQYYNQLIVGRASMLCKADLTSGMVGEFPKLQGVMGREYARIDGEPQEICNALYEHYLPAFAGDKLPASQVGAIISIADKLDTIVGCFGVGLIPTGAEDPYGLRRQTLAIIAIIRDKNYRVNLDKLVDIALDVLKDKLARNPQEVKKDVLEFFKERLKNSLLAEVIAHDSIEAALATPWFDMVDAVNRINSLEKFKTHPSYKSLVIAFKRVSNILKGVDFKNAPTHPTRSPSGFPDGFPDEKLFQDELERSLWKAYKDIVPKINKFSKEGDYERLFSTLASIKDVIDRFFDKVMVMVEDKGVRENRLKLLHSVRSLYYQIADLSKLVI